MVVPSGIEFSNGLQFSFVSFSTLSLFYTLSRTTDHFHSTFGNGNAARRTVVLYDTTTGGFRCML